MDLSPLRRHRDFRQVFIGHAVSALGRPRLVAPTDLPAVSASSLHGSTAAIAGPALAGVCIATLGLPAPGGAETPA